MVNVKHVEGGGPYLWYSNQQHQYDELCSLHLPVNKDLKKKKRSYKGVSKSFRTGHLERELQMV
jgi:hypothetical protein